MKEENVLTSSRAEKFYTESLQILNETGVPFMVGGTFAVNAYVGIERPTKDMDIFCKSADCGKIMQIFAEHGYKTQMTDERWLAKVYKGKFFFDIIFNSSIAVMPITDDWFKESQTAKIYNIEVKVLPPTELIWSKSFVQSRDKFDGNDIAHLIILKNKNINWKRLFGYMDQYWEVLLMHILRFRFIYPSEREMIPRWLVDELIERFNNQINLPTSKEKVCRGRLLSLGDFEIDVHEWGFTDLIGWRYEPRK
jgi:predicted nucleotidyltransferase